MPLTVILNGHSRRFDNLAAGTNINILLEALELKPDRVALEVNGSIAPRPTWPDLLLEDHDKIELVHFVGGGANTSSYL